MGFGVCALYTGAPAEIPAKALLFKNLNKWIKAHSIITVSLNFITTSLMVYRVWSTKRTSSKYSLFPSRLDAVLRIILESAMLQLITELLLLIFHVLWMAETFIFLQILVPIIAITFNTMTLRMKLNILKDSLGSLPSFRTSRLGIHSSVVERDLPMQPIQISVDIRSHRAGHDFNLEVPFGSDPGHEHRKSAIITAHRR
ncbi:hypothetical protein PQX77_003323 [Marasmius sp. AFHP31]|nr:hypothetical protein PQX77_003323 [Marasmius sp. AFHP31]